MKQILILFYPYSLEKFNNYTLPGKSVSIQCKLVLLCNKTINSVVWSDDHPYNPDIITIKDDEVSYSRTGFYLANDFEEEDLDMSDTALLTILK